MGKASPIRIVCAANDAYAKPMAVMLTSLLINKKSRIPVRIYVIDGGGLSARNKDRLRRAAAAYGAGISFIPFDNAKLAGLSRLSIYKRYGKEAFYRIFIPELLGPRVKRALYLDSDLIVRKDITRLWRLPLRGFLAAAARDPSAPRMTRRLGLPKGKYFNSGVLLINMEGWRKFGVRERVIRHVQKNRSRIRFPDQDGLNAVLKGRVRFLSHYWNCPAFRFRTFPKHAILHFMTPKKPWLAGKRPRGARLYRQYAAKTAWE